MSRTLKSLLACAVLAAGTFAGLAWLSEHRPLPARRQVRELGPVPVAHRRLTPEPAELWVRAFGTLIPVREARLAFELGGTVSEVRHPWLPGDAVEPGELLVRLDTTLFDAELRRAQAARSEARAAQEAARVDQEFAASALELAQERLDLSLEEEQRAEELEESGDLSRSLRDDARRARVAAATLQDEAHRRVSQAAVAVETAAARLMQSDAQCELAAERLRRAELRAPFAGRLDGRGPELGTHLLPGEPVVRLLDLSTMHLVTQVDEGEARALRPGMLARVQASGAAGPELPGSVRSVGVVADPRTRAVEVEVELSNPGAGGLELDGRASDLLRAGEFCAASLLVRRDESALLLRTDEHVWIDGQACAFVALRTDSDPDGRARLVIERREVTLGARMVTADGRHGREVLDGLAPGEILITAPLSRLRGGEPCELASEEAAR